MTRFEVIRWYYRILALVGIVSPCLSLIGNLFSYLFNSGGFWGSAIFSPLPIAANIFLWLLAETIATEMTGEDRSSDALITRQDLARLLLPCVGLSSLLAGLISGGWPAIYFVYQHFSSPAMAPQNRFFMFSSLAVGFIQALLGIVLAFGPRLLRLFRSP